MAARCAEYLGYFVANDNVGNMPKGTQWLVWRFESDSTLQGAPRCAPACAVGWVGGPFPPSPPVLPGAQSSERRRCWLETGRARRLQALRKAARPRA